MLKRTETALALMEAVLVLLLVSILVSGAHSLVFRSQRSLASIAQALRIRVALPGECLTERLSWGQDVRTCGEVSEPVIILGNR